MRVWPVCLAVFLCAGFACSPEPAPTSSAPPVAAAPAPQPASGASSSVIASLPPGDAQDSGPPKAWIGPLPPLQLADYPAGRPPETVKAVYEYAARHPEVLHYVPCFCGCERSGHRNNDDCFVSAREANGRPIWEPHGAT